MTVGGFISGIALDETRGGADAGAVALTASGGSCTGGSVGIQFPHHLSLRSRKNVFEASQFGFEQFEMIAVFSDIQGIFSEAHPWLRNRKTNVFSHAGKFFFSEISANLKPFYLCQWEKNNHLRTKHAYQKRKYYREKWASFSHAKPQGDGDEK